MAGLIALTGATVLAPPLVCWLLARRGGWHLASSLLVSLALVFALGLGVEALVEGALADLRETFRVGHGAPHDWAALSQAERKAVIEEIRGFEARGRLLVQIRPAATGLALAGCALLLIWQTYRWRLNRRFDPTSGDP